MPNVPSRKEPPPYAPPPPGGYGPQRPFHVVQRPYTVPQQAVHNSVVQKTWTSTSSRAQFEGSTALVTGGFKGIGEAIGDMLLKGGCKVCFVDLHLPEAISMQAFLDKKAKQKGVHKSRFWYAKADVSSHREVENAFHKCKAMLGEYPNIVVCNAGILRSTKFLDISVDEWNLMHNVNLNGVFNAMQLGCKHMVQRSEKLRAEGKEFFGRVIVMSSQAGRSVSKLGGAHYTSSKAAVIGLTRAAAQEMGKHGITVNAICPGIVKTDMSADVIGNAGGSHAGKTEEAFTNLPIPRLGTTEDIANLVKFVASKEASYITGSCHDINGGQIML